MLSVANTDPYTSQYITTAWASLGFAVKDSYNAAIESNAPFGVNNSYEYTKSGTFFNKGGYLLILNVTNSTL